MYNMGTIWQNFSNEGNYISIGFISMIPTLNLSLIGVLFILSLYDM